MFALIVDSPFPSLGDVIQHLGSKKTGLPGFIVQTSLHFANAEVKRKAGFDMNKIEM